jgi:hypothetical protein
VAAPVAALTLALATSAQAATASGWTVVYTHHYGKASNYSGYSAVAAVGPADAWALGTTNGAGLPAPGTPVAVHWNGTSWSRSLLPSGLTSEIAAASAVSSNDVWAVTEVGGNILHWNGAQWSVADHVNGSGRLFTGVTALSSTDVWVFGFSGAGPGLGTWHFDGKIWTNVTGSAAMLTTASAVSATDIWAVGDTTSGQGAIRHYNGTTWQQVTAAPALGYQDILALSSSNVWALGTDSHGALSLAHLSGGRWTTVTLPGTGFYVGSFAPDGQGGFWLSASGTTGGEQVMHYLAAGRWSRTSFAAGIGSLALIPGTTSVLGAGGVRTATGENARIWVHGTLG